METLTRKKCEDEICKHLEKLWETYRKYNPNGDYLTICLRNNFITVNNAHWEEIDKKRPLDFYVIDGKKGSLLRGK